MAKYKAKKKDNRLTIFVKLSKDEKLNDREFDFFNRKYVRGLLGGKLVKKNKIEYSGPVAVSLYDRLAAPVSKRDFLYIIEQGIEIVRKVNENGLAVNKIVFDIKNVYINELTREMSFIYLPLEGARGESKIMNFIDEVIYSSRPYDVGGPDFVSKFVEFLRSLNTNDLNQIESYIQKEDRSVVNSIKGPTGNPSGGSYTNHSGNPSVAQGYSNQGNQSGYNGGAAGSINYTQSAYGAYGNQNGYNNYAGQFNSGGQYSAVNQQYQYDDLQTGKMEDKDNSYMDDYQTGILDDGTGLLADDESTGLLVEGERQINYPKLYRVQTEEMIPINKAVFRIGKEQSYADYFVGDNSAVSRNHCDIIVRGTRYFVMDLNSKNRTFINDHVIPVRQETEIFDGDRLKLANEEFVFYSG